MPPLTSRRYKLVLAYDGSAFFGWAKQHPPGGAPLRTVQGVTEDTLRRILKPAPAAAGPGKLNLMGASRTDAGVHAAGQIATFDAATYLDLTSLHRTLRASLPDDVDCRSAEIVPGEFNVIGDAVAKQYRYRVWLGPPGTTPGSGHRVKPLGLRHLVASVEEPLDLQVMHEAAADLVGEHDFAAFAAAGHNRTSTVRTVTRCELEEHPDLPGGPELHLVIAGSGFLYKMIRIVVGTLVDIGRGRMRYDAVRHALFDPQRSNGGTTFPPNGLCLEWIEHVRPDGNGEAA
ncbi:tRNA pseudouridine synthase A [Phycisphaera mikurensis]|uniref:tRNA pseudouridine synthase A n=1 Tax=Phycisphaera mikurensis (strain NBRC 102666 / KCTC 22515 / FYK2301M01) TaxID=1142394 RepID=I0II31_PHYMF|nr:tRNA pseudouridine synthase A [Phycisphaera mikurensis]MBB6442518.1 tRNA pseudouridine38-40 synthase [Phycisphaera mikurensis]BAM04919.1 tRNA pseudouridine synthase A [Phycisphaera mikurensis NBRC 102666]